MRCEFGILVKRQAALRWLCAALFCVDFSTAPAATVQWYVIGDPPHQLPLPSSFVTTPSAPTTSDTISFVAPTDGKVYLNSIAAAVSCGNPIISVDSTNRIVAVTFTAPLDEAIPNVAILVSGINGQFGPLGAGNWVFEVFTNSGSLALSNNFIVTGPRLGMALASNQVVLSWPAAASNYVLQAATDLSSGHWSNITNGITSNGTNYVFTSAISTQAAYFRLEEQ
jgi:hypothetical protein